MHTPMQTVIESPGNSNLLGAPFPAAQPVDGAATLSEVLAVIQPHVSLDRQSAIAMALWVAYSYLYDSFSISPMLCLSSPEKRCGKTTTIGVLSGLVRMPLPTSNISTAALFRVVEEKRPTLLVDEADTFVKINRELRGILNSSHNRAAAYIIRAAGGKTETRVFSTWCPKAVALIGALPETLEDRSIVVRMRRRAPNDVVRKMSPSMIEEQAPLRSRLEGWARDNGIVLSKADPQIPDQLHDRAADNWAPLLAIADLVGGMWPQEAREAAVKLSAAVSADEGENLSLSLLRDVKTVFEQAGRPRLFTSELIHRLKGLEEGLWGSMRGANRLDPHLLSGLLKPFEIRPTLLRIGSAVGRGYEVEDCQDAFTRYLSEDRYSVTALLDDPASNMDDLPHAVEDDSDVDAGLARMQKQNVTM